MRKERIMKYYCGPKKRKKYFEGWYFKHASRDLKIAFIPSISVLDGEKKAYVQVISNLFSDCFEFPPEDFSADDKSLSIKIGNNHFSERGININLTNPKHEIKADLKYSELLIPKNIMGPFKYFPKMECVHSIFSMKHSVYGSISLNGREYFFYDNLGYIEGDRGASFPEKYVWIQGNDLPNGAFSLSIATIPLGPFKFTGLIALLYVGMKEYRFATYNNTKIIKNAEDHIRLKKGKLLLDVFIRSGKSFMLSAPVKGLMARRVGESMDAEIEIALSKKGVTIYRGIAKNASVERG